MTTASLTPAAVRARLGAQGRAGNAPAIARRHRRAALAVRAAQAPADAPIVDRRSLLASTASFAAMVATGELSLSACPGAAAAAIGGPALTLTGSSKPFPLASFGLQVYDDETARKLTLLALEVRGRAFQCAALANLSTSAS